MPRRPGWLAYVHFRAISCRCQRSNVSGVTIVAISRKAVRPTRYARAASRRRSSSVRRSRRIPSWRRRKPVLFNQVRDGLPLPAVQPAGQHAQHHLQRRGVDHESELISQVRQTSAELRNTTGFGKHVAQDGKYPARNGLPPEAAKDFINRLPGMAGGGQFLRILRFLFVPATRPRPAPNRLVGSMFS
jgi:hypothetical protein